MAESGLITMRNPIRGGEVETVIDAAGQIRVCVTHCVMIVPTLHTEAWLAAIQATADRLGWDMVVVGLDGDIPITRRHETFAILLDAAAMDRLAVDRFALISTGLASTAEAAVSMFGVERERSLVYASRILALGQTLAPMALRHYSDQDLMAGRAVFAVFDGVDVVTPELTPIIADAGHRRAVALALRHLTGETIAVGASAEWSPDLFIYNSGEPASPEIGRVDVGGLGRPLVHGPYICLPAGKWRVEIRFAVNRETARHSYRLEWGDMTAQTILPFSPDRPGYYSMTADYDWPHVNISELQIAIGESSLGGEFQFQGARIERVE